MISNYDSKLKSILRFITLNKQKETVKKNINKLNFHKTSDMCVKRNVYQKKKNLVVLIRPHFTFVAIVAVTVVQSRRKVIHCIIKKGLLVILMCQNDEDK